MGKYAVRPLQLRLLRILDAFHEMCEVRGLRYYLVDGTLLGAVRHCGFIPWDDDLDVAMPRPDYELLIRNCREWLPEPLEFVSYEIDQSYPLHFGKVQDASTTLIERPHLFYLGGIYIDVFPIDGAPGNRVLRKIHSVRYNFLRKSLYFAKRDPYRHGHGVSSWLPLLTRKLMSPDWLQCAIRREMTRYSFGKSELVGINLNDGIPAMLSRENILGEPAPVEFEGKQFNGMRDNDAYLSSLFGNYMTPPPEGNRHVHDFYYLDLDSPYRSFDPSVLRK